MRHVSGYITLSQRLLAEAESNERAFAELEWIATHWDEATEEQRDRYREFERACDEDELSGWSGLE